MARVTIQEALDYCLANPDGLSAEELLKRFPEYRDELQPLLAISADLASITPPPVPDDRRTLMKQRLMRAASARQVTASVPVTPLRSRSAKAGQVPTPWLVAWLRRPAFALTAVVILLLGSVWSASANSLPDSPFYSAKLTSENLLLNFVSSAADKVRRHMDLANVRLSDLQTMQNRNKLVQAGPAFTNYSYHLSNGVAIWNSTTGDTRTELARILYTSSVAGQYTFSALRSTLSNSSTQLQDDYNQTARALNDLNTNTAQVLEAARVDPATLLQSGAPEVADVAGRARIDARNLLTPVPAVELFAPNQSGTTTAVARESVTSTVQATPEQTSSVLAATSSVVASTVLPGTPTVPTSVTPAATKSPAATSTLPRVNATATPTSGKPTPQASPSRRATPGATPPRPGATSTRPAAPSATARPPSRTPTVHLAPTNTPLPTSTSIPTATPASTSTSTLVTATVPSAASCGLTVQSVLTSCNAQGCLNWIAIVENTGFDRVKATWIAELQIKSGSGNFHAVASDQKKVNVALGANSISGNFCVTLPPDTTSVRVKLTITADDNSCSVAATSSAAAPCLAAIPTPVPRPTREPAQQPTVPPNATDEPRPTRAPRATPEPRRTQGPEETREPDGNPDPSPRETRQPRPTREPQPFSALAGL